LSGRSSSNLSYQVWLSFLMNSSDFFGFFFLLRVMTEEFLPPLKKITQCAASLRFSPPFFEQDVFPLQLIQPRSLQMRSLRCSFFGRGCRASPLEMILCFFPLDVHLYFLIGVGYDFFSHKSLPYDGGVFPPCLGPFGPSNSLTTPPSLNLPLSFSLEIRV